LKFKVNGTNNVHVNYIIRKLRFSAPPPYKKMLIVTIYHYMSGFTHTQKEKKMKYPVFKLKSGM